MQLRVLAVVREHYTRTGFAPTMRHIGDVLGRDKVTIFGHFCGLVRAGLLRRTGSRTNSRYIPVDVCPTCGKALTP